MLNLLKPRRWLAESGYLWLEYLLREVFERWSIDGFWGWMRVLPLIFHNIYDGSAPEIEN